MSADSSYHYASWANRSRFSVLSCGSQTTRHQIRNLDCCHHGKKKAHTAECLPKCSNMHFSTNVASRMLSLEAFACAIHPLACLQVHPPCVEIGKGSSGSYTGQSGHDPKSDVSKFPSSKASPRRSCVKETKPQVAAFTSLEYYRSCAVCGAQGSWHGSTIRTP